MQTHGTENVEAESEKVTPPAPCAMKQCPLGDLKLRRTGAPSESFLQLSIGASQGLLTRNVYSAPQAIALISKLSWQNPFSPGYVVIETLIPRLVMDIAYSSVIRAAVVLTTVTTVLVAVELINNTLYNEPLFRDSILKKTRGMQPHCKFNKNRPKSGLKPLPVSKAS